MKEVRIYRGGHAHGFRIVWMNFNHHCSQVLVEVTDKIGSHGRGHREEGVV